LRSDWVRPGPRGYAQGGHREGGVLPGTGCQTLPERERDEEFLCDEELRGCSQGGLGGASSKYGPPFGGLARDAPPATAPPG
jgi:hypothetical protein